MMYSTEQRAALILLYPTQPREHEGTERDTPSPRFVICHSQTLKLFIDWLSNGSMFSETSRIKANLVQMWSVRKRRRALGQVL